MAENGNELHVSQKGENCGYFPDQLTEISVLFLRQLGLYEPEMDTLISQIWIRRAAMNPGDGDELRRVMFEKMKCQLAGNAVDDTLNVRLISDTQRLIQQAMETYASLQIAIDEARNAADLKAVQDYVKADSDSVKTDLDLDKAIAQGSMSLVDQSLRKTENRMPENVLDGKGGVAEQNTLSNQQCEQHSDSSTHRLTFREGYERYMAFREGAAAPRKVKTATQARLRSVAPKLNPLFDRPMDDISLDEMQELLNGINLSRTMVSKVGQLLSGTYEYCYSRELCTRNPAKYLIIPETKPVKHYEPFTDEELKILWANQDRPIVKMILIMCYSGYRIAAFPDMEINLKEGFFKGGVKTETSRNRVVPIHSCIRPFVDEIMTKEKGRFLCGKSQDWFRKLFYRELRLLGIDNETRHHSPHSCRHTFSRLCESYQVREADRKRMMGHSFGADITNGVYGHRTLDELRTEIEKIQKPDQG